MLYGKHSRQQETESKVTQIRGKENVTCYKRKGECDHDTTATFKVNRELSQCIKQDKESVDKTTTGQWIKQELVNG